MSLCLFCFSSYQSLFHIFRYFLFAKNNASERNESLLSNCECSLFSAQRYKKIPISADYPVKRSAISNPPGRLAGDFLLTPVGRLSFKQIVHRNLFLYGVAMFVLLQSERSNSPVCPL